MSLSKEDLSAIAALLQEQDKRFDKKLEKQSKRLENLLDKRLRKTENAILSEVDRVQEIGDKNMKKLEQRLAEMESYYRINRNDSNQSTLLLQMILELKDEIETVKNAK